MEKYISAEAAAEKLRNYRIERDLMVSHNDTIDFAISVISAEVTPADVRPVVRAEWIETGYFDLYHQPIYECSHCHREVADNFIANHLFCLHCGADMKKTGR